MERNKTKLERIVIDINKTESNRFVYYKVCDTYYIQVCDNYYLITDFKDKHYCKSKINIKNKLKIQLGLYLLDIVIRNRYKLKLYDKDEIDRNLKDFYLFCKNLSESVNGQHDGNKYVIQNKSLIEFRQNIKNRKRNIKK